MIVVLGGCSTSRRAEHFLLLFLVEVDEVESFAIAEAAGVMVEDQTWPKRGFPFPSFQDYNMLFSIVAN